MFSVHFPCNNKLYFHQTSFENADLHDHILKLHYHKQQSFHFLNMFLSLSLENIFIFLVKFLSF